MERVLTIRPTGKERGWKKGVSFQCPSCSGVLFDTDFQRPFEGARVFRKPALKLNDGHWGEKCTIAPAPHLMYNTSISHDTESTLASSNCGTM